MKIKKLSTDDVKAYRDTLMKLMHLCYEATCPGLADDAFCGEKVDGLYQYLKDGKAKVKGLRSMKTGKTYDGTVLFGRYRRQVCELPRGTEGQKLKTASIGSVATLPENGLPRPLPGRVRFRLLG